ncbi:MAG: DUF3108 domain-containing protein [Magnetococcales bacterium]|nr:DUF3108 domain-containing protein [Magnetococcales bacterium]
MASKKKKYFYTNFCFALCLTVFFISNNSMAEQTVYGAVPGEKLVFNVHWLGVPGGRAEMVMAKAPVGSYKLEAKVKTIGVVSFFRPLKDKLQSVGDRLEDGGYRTRVFTRFQRRGKKNRKTTVKFDQENGLVTRTSSYEKPQEINLTSDNVNDSLALFYAIRSLPELKPNTTLQWYSVGRKQYDVRIEIGEAKQQSLPLGMQHVIPIKLIVPTGVGLVRQEEALTIWLSTDKRRMPFRVETRLSLGNVAADLVEYNDGRGGRGELSE